ncbi:MAG: ribonuclease P protein component [Rhodobacteraceae bacterium]|jgi:ribonuclease P protein component|uniref:ribonuclease P protein component n=1 Tax=uncultured Planktomarina sp. TaxID=1538529 RepID=UPI002A02396D|nr:ribonuclease P protein component [Paracoccaceae bacterium]MBT6521509.1 ribonuclease P protein component [Paracoccaceae bacterium]
MSEFSTDKSGDHGSSDLLVLERLKQRKDFLRLAHAKRVHSTSFVLQARDRGDAQALRVGFTCSKKVGNAVARNRAKRRLREIARLILPQFGQIGHDYVLIGRANVTASTKFTALQDELLASLRKLQAKP